MSKSTSSLLTRAVATVFVVLLVQFAIRSQVSNANVAVKGPVIPSSKIESTTEEKLKALEEEMREAARDLRFEYAARLRDEIHELKRELKT